MAVVSTQLTIEEFEDQYGHESGWEYWFEEAVRKPIPDWLHGILQILLAELLRTVGYYTAAELDLHIDPNWRPPPDVAGALFIEGRYPTRPIDIAIEILSDDQMNYLYEKCAHYARIGIQQIFLFDPKHRLIKVWNSTLTISIALKISNLEADRFSMERQSGPNSKSVSQST